MAKYLGSTIPASGILLVVLLAGVTLALVLGLGRPRRAWAAELPAGYWDADRTQPLMEKTLEIELAPDLSQLSAGESAAVDKLLRAGAILQRLYERQRHGEALGALERLTELDARLGSPQTLTLRKLYRLFQGPIATTLDNQRLPFLPVDPVVPGKNVYPPGVTPEELEQSPAEDLLHVRSVVRRATPAQVHADLQTLDRYPELDALHPGLRERVERAAAAARSAKGDDGGLYALPYSVAYAEPLREVSRLLALASEDVELDDPDFAAFLRLRSRDLLVDDYEAGDAAWVTGEFRNLNAQIGSYETYDDELMGVKSFFSLSILALDRERSAELTRAVPAIQDIENALPYARHKQVRRNIPVNVYNVVADFGQSRGTNTATILPNEAQLARKYGRTILLRYNIMTHPELFPLARSRFQAAVEPAFHDDLTLDSNFRRTLWHEIGHYLGVAETEHGTSLDVALQQYSDLLEELKADLVSLFAAPILRDQGFHDDDALRSIYASGVLRVLQVVKPRREQPYQTMQLMQWNYFLENDVLDFDAASGRLRIDYDAYPGAVEALLTEVLAVQSAGDPQAAGRFVDRWATWDEDLHGVVAQNLRDALSTRYRLVRYSILDSEGSAGQK